MDKTGDFFKGTADKTGDFFKETNQKYQISEKASSAAAATKAWGVNLWGRAKTLVAKKEDKGESGAASQDSTDAEETKEESGPIEIQ